MSDPGRARLFVAVEIADEARRELARLPHSLPNAKFVRAEHLHVTLARVRAPPPAGELKGFLDTHSKIQSPEFTIAEIVLFESVLSPAGPTYSRLATVSLS